jgi:hypothetical protein
MLESSTSKLGFQCVLESRVAVQGEIVLDQAVSHLARHLAVGHLMSGQVLGGETRAVDAGGDFILVDGTQVEVLKLREFAVFDLAVCLDLTEVDHDAGYELVSR